MLFWLLFCVDWRKGEMILISQSKPSFKNWWLKKKVLCSIFFYTKKSLEVFWTLKTGMFFIVISEITFLSQTTAVSTKLLVYSVLTNILPKEFTNKTLLTGFERLIIEIVIFHAGCSVCLNKTVFLLNYD